MSYIHTQEVAWSHTDKEQNSVYWSIEESTQQNTKGVQRKKKEYVLLSAQRERKVSWALWCWVKWGGFARATLLLVDISKVKLLKGNSTSKTNRKWALGWLTDGSGVCACVCSPRVCVCVCTLSKNHFSLRGEEGETDTHLCLYIGPTLSHLPSQVTAFLVFCQ